MFVIVKSRFGALVKHSEVLDFFEIFNKFCMWPTYIPHLSWRFNVMPAKTKK